MKKLFRLMSASLLAVAVTTSVSADVPLPSMHNFDRIPTGVFEQMADSTKSVGFVGLAWPNLQGQSVTVAFNGGDPGLYALIESTAAEWTENGGRLKFSFRKSDGSYRTFKETDLVRAADIRIGFFTDSNRNGYWSAVGVLARRVNSGQPTMNFGDLKSKLQRYYGGSNRTEWLQSYSHSVVLHEFGHALSLNHEHFHPKCQIDLKLDQAVTWLMGPPNRWTNQQAMFNMDATTYFNVMASQTAGQHPAMTPNTDQASVMLYSFNDSFYRSGALSPCRPSGQLHYATTLSALDRAYYAKIYVPGN